VTEAAVASATRELAVAAADGRAIGIEARLGRAMAIDVESLYRRYGDLVLGRCRTLLGSDVDAQEACQEIFLRVHRYSATFRGDASPSTFLFRVTTNHCLNVLRTRRRRPEDAEEDLSFVADVMKDRAESRELLDRVLAGQDEKTTQCIVYHMLDGMTHEETGQLVGLSGAAVRKRLAKFKREIAGRAHGLLVGGKDGP
jgi:RNA polymerase sigma-70 factor, ECF subfamily